VRCHLRRIFHLLGLPPLAGIIATAVVILWITAIIATGAHVNLFPVEWDFSNSGAFGDSFGPLSALMASVAAVSAIAAFRAQASEITRLQDRQAAEDEDRKLERAALERRQQELDTKSEKTSFEDTFFKLLEAFRSLVSQIDIKTLKGANKSAHDAFGSMLSIAENSARASDWNLSSVWAYTIDRYRNDLNHYFRFMYHIVQFVDQSSIDNKYFYVRLLRAMLSDSEIVLLGLNCEYGEGKDKFYPLIKQYALLHNISADAKLMWFGKTNMDHGVFGLR
jgi:hypothetical protein